LFSAKVKVASWTYFIDVLRAARFLPPLNSRLQKLGLLSQSGWSELPSSQSACERAGRVRWSCAAFRA